MESEQIIVLGTKSLCFHRNLCESGPMDITEIDTSKDIKFFRTSPDLRYLGWSKSQCIEIARIDNISIRKSIEISRNQSLGFSPKSTFVWFWNSPSDFVSDKPENNFFIYQIVEKGQDFDLVSVYTSYIKSYSQSELYWLDEESCFQVSHQTLKFYKNCAFDHQVELSGLVRFSMKSSFACMCLQPKDLTDPSFIKLFKYPNFTTNALASQPFYDKRDFEFFWNHKGNIVLVTCQDKKPVKKLYYGNINVYFLGFKGEAFQIEMGSDETIWDVSWFPLSDKFAIIHGDDARKLTFYNNSGDPIETVTKGIFNKILFNPFESVFMLCGSGSVKCHTEFWALEKKTVISYVETPIASDILFMPDGVNIIYCATFPRVCIDNGYQMINYHGKTVNRFIVEKVNGCQVEDILQIQPVPINESILSSKPVISIPKEPIDLRKKKVGKYVPPSSRTCNTYPGKERTDSPNPRAPKKKKTAPKRKNVEN